MTGEEKHHMDSLKTFHVAEVKQITPKVFCILYQISTNDITVANLGAT